jgi:hypothetical protein
VTHLYRYEIDPGSDASTRTSHFERKLRRSDGTTWVLLTPSTCSVVILNAILTLWNVTLTTGFILAGVIKSVWIYRHHNISRLRSPRADWRLDVKCMGIQGFCDQRLSEALSNCWEEEKTHTDRVCRDTQCVLDTRSCEATIL